MRQRWGGSLLEEATLSGAVKLLTVAQHVVEAADPVAVEPFAPELSEADLAVRVVRREEPPPGTVSLTDARVVVGGGRGVGSAEGFAVLEELAALLGGAVGGSRVVTNLGWRAHADQVGQTGAQDRSRPLHRLRDQRRDPAHRRLQGREEDPGDQQIRTEPVDALLLDAVLFTAIYSRLRAGSPALTSSRLRKRGLQRSELFNPNFHRLGCNAGAADRSRPECFNLPDRGTAIWDDTH